MLRRKEISIAWTIARAPRHSRRRADRDVAGVEVLDVDGGSGSRLEASPAVGAAAHQGGRRSARGSSGIDLEPTYQSASHLFTRSETLRHTCVPASASGCQISLLQASMPAPGRCLVRNEMPIGRAIARSSRHRGRPGRAPGHQDGADTTITHPNTLRGADAPWRPPGGREGVVGVGWVVSGIPRGPGAADRPPGTVLSEARSLAEPVGLFPCAVRRTRGRGPARASAHL